MKLDLSWALGSAALVMLAIVGEGLMPQAIAAQTTSPATPATTTTFPNVDADYWATPFIEALAARNVVVGYPDGTYRPEQPVDRDEFASMIRGAFEQEPVRQIPSGSVFEDVSDSAWAESDIEAAYEMGFMSGFPGGFFYPRQPIPKVEAITALASGLNLTLAGQPTPPTGQTAPPPAPSTPAAVQPRQPISLTEGLWALVTGQVQFQPRMRRMQAAPPAKTPPAAETPAAPPTTTAAVTPIAILNRYYTDADAIPPYARTPVAAATQADIVVNYPDVNTLNPKEFVTRGMAAALIHQAMVHQGNLEPLATDVEATRYIVGRENAIAQPQAGQ